MVGDQGFVHRRRSLGRHIPIRHAFLYTAFLWHSYTAFIRHSWQHASTMNLVRGPCFDMSPSLSLTLIIVMSFSA